MAAAADPLTAAEALDLADALRGADGALRGRLLLSAARPQWPAVGLSGTSLGDGETCVLALRCATFGNRLKGRKTCPACGAQLALEIDAEVLCVEPAPWEPAERAPFALEREGFEMSVRSPDAALLEAAAATADPERARDVLLRGCLSDLRGINGPVDPAALTPSVVDAIGEAIVLHDPQAEVRLALTCASCGHAWTCLFDAAAFLSAELENLAAHLVEEVHTLAAAYGWSEEQVLTLPSRRRQRYVERVAVD